VVSVNSGKCIDVVAIVVGTVVLVVALNRRNK
jgi:hypothetical protein